MFDIHRKCRYFKFCQGLQRSHDNVAENSKIFSTHFTKKMFGKGVGGGVNGVYMKLKKSHLYRDTSLLLYAMLRQVQCRVYFVLFDDCNTTTPLRISI